MVFFHGWPDTSATFANYFAKFCGTDKEYFCVAPSWIDFHPDVPPATSTSELTLENQRANFLAVIQELGLTDITLVMFDFGADIGYGFVYENAGLISRVVAMDIPMKLEPPTVPFQGILDYYPEGNYIRNNVEAFLEEDDEAMNYNVLFVLTGDIPCRNCSIAPEATIGVGARTGWPYYDNYAKYEPAPFTEAFDVPANLWEFSMAPSFPAEIPLLYLYSPTFVDDDWNAWVDQRGDGLSEQVLVPDSDHWFPVWKGAETTATMAEWLNKVDNAAATTQPTAQPTSNAMIMTWCRTLKWTALLLPLIFVGELL